MAELLQNPAQEEAIRWINGPMILISCPGSGKTTTLLRRIRYMVESGIAPSKILMVTFSKEAARDMKERYQQLFQVQDGVTFSTIHAFCLAILRAEGIHSVSDIISEKEKMDLVLNVLRTISSVADPFTMAVDILSEIGVMKNTYTPLRRFSPEKTNKNVFDKVYRIYEEYKEENGKIDYEDMLLLTKELLEEHPEILKKYTDRFPYILCDEYQDVNPVQRDILYFLAGEKKNLCVVGDDDQSIYRFRGASPDMMQQFEKDFAGCKVLYMSTNYRSLGNIVLASDTLISHNTRRFKKEFVSFRGKTGEEGQVEYQVYDGKQEEMEALSSLILAYHAKGIPYEDMAILFRTNKQAQLPMRELMEKKIPFTCREKVKSIYDDWLFSIIRSYLNLSMGSWTQSDLLNVLNKPNRYYKFDWFYGAEEFSYSAFSERLSRMEASGAAQWQVQAAKKNLDIWFQAFGPGKIRPGDPPEKVFRALAAIDLMSYIQEYAELRKAESQDILAMYEILRQDALQYKTVSDWLMAAEEGSGEMRTLQIAGSQKDGSVGVTVCTMHKAKGQEWPICFLIDLNAEVVPHQSNVKDEEGLEEERRLLYVAMTRAKDQLHLMCSGKQEESPFVKPVMEEYLKKVRLQRYPKPKVGDIFEHRKFGRGTVVEVAPTTIVMDFGSSTRRFAFPETIERGYLKK